MCFEAIRAIQQRKKQQTSAPTTPWAMAVANIQEKQAAKASTRKSGLGGI